MFLKFKMMFSHLVVHFITLRPQNQYNHKLTSYDVINENKSYLLYFAFCLLCQ